MLKREISYEDFDGNPQTEIFYFNISMPELAEMEVEFEEGFSTWINKVIEAKDNKTILQQFQRLILKSYGEKSEDGRLFVKNEELSTRFSQTAAYQALFMEMLESPDAAANFFQGVLPKNIVAETPKAVTPPAPPI